MSTIGLLLIQKRSCENRGVFVYWMCLKSAMLKNISKGILDTPLI